MLRIFKNQSHLVIALLSKKYSKNHQNLTIESKDCLLALKLVFLPIFNNHLAPFIEYSSYSYNDAEVEGNLNFSEFGASYFFNKSGKGLYVGVGLSSLKFDILYNNISLDLGKTGSGSTEIALNTTNLKSGFKTGGKIYLRLEMGYGLGDLPTQVTFVASENSNPSYTETTTEDIPDIPGISETGLIIGNIGFGLSF